MRLTSEAVKRLRERMGAEIVPMGDKDDLLPHDLAVDIYVVLSACEVDVTPFVPLHNPAELRWPEPPSQECRDAGALGYECGRRDGWAEGIAAVRRVLSGKAVLERGVRGTCPVDADAFVRRMVRARDSRDYRPWLAGLMADVWRRAYAASPFRWRHRDPLRGGRR